MVDRAHPARMRPEEVGMTIKVKKVEKVRATGITYD
jgi:hypothetical protein